jgi:hypothetical protein
MQNWQFCFGETIVHDSIVWGTDGKIQINVNVDQEEEAFNAIVNTGATVSVLGKRFMNMIANNRFTLRKQFSGKCVILYVKQHSTIRRIKQIKQTFQLLISSDSD